MSIASKKNREELSRALNTSVKDRLIKFVESSVETRRIIFDELAIYQGLACSAFIITRYLRKTRFRRCLAISKS